MTDSMHWCILSPVLYLFLSRRSNPELGIRRRYEALVTVAFPKPRTTDRLGRGFFAQGGRRGVLCALFILGTPLASTPLAAQWVKYRTAGVPRKADGKVDMSAPAPRLTDGKPDFSGIWMTGEPNMPRPGSLSSPKEAASPRQPQNPSDSPGDQSNIRASRQMANIGVDLSGGLPYQPWLVPIVKERTDNLAKDDPHIRCLPDNFLRAYGLPHLLKFVHTPNLLGVLNEMNAGYRRVFTDAAAPARALLELARELRHPLGDDALRRLPDLGVVRDGRAVA